MDYTKRDESGMYVVDNSSGPGPRLMGASTLIGNDVFNGQEENLGSIKEIMLDVRAGRISYAVLSFGGFMGVGEKLFAVPWAALELDTERKRFTLDVAKDRMEAAPGFDKDDWPNMSNLTWGKEVHDYYGITPPVDPAV